MDYEMGLRVTPSFAEFAVRSRRACLNDFEEGIKASYV